MVRRNLFAAGIVRPHRRPPARLLPIRGAPAPRYPIGINVTGMNYGLRVYDSPDLLMCAQDPVLTRIQATLAAPYVAGSGTMALAGPNPFTIDVQNGQGVAVNGFANTTAGPASFAATAVGGLPYLYDVAWGKAAWDVDYPAGTYVNHARSGWANPSKSPADWPVRPEFVDAGRPTGYPAGLAPGQQVCISTNTYLGSQQGAYTVLAKGAGTISFSLGVGKAWIPISVSGGVASGPLVLAPGQGIYQAWLTASSPADPLRDIRVVVPDRPGRADNFVAAYRAHADDPQYKLFHPDWIASLRPFSMLRYMDLMGANNNPMVIEWADRPAWSGTRPGIDNPPYEYLAELANQAGRDSWWCVPIAASDDYARRLARLIVASVRAPLRVAVEYANENWNAAFQQFYFLARMAMATYSQWAAKSVAYDPAANACTASLPGHGFAAGATVQVENAADDAFNGAYTIRVVDADTFAYTPAVAPRSAAADPRPFHRVMCLDAASRWALAVQSMSWDGRRTITVTTAAPHGLGYQDFVQLAGAADPAFNGIWAATAVDATRFSVSFVGDGYNRPLPAAPAPGAVAPAPRPGQQLRAWRVGNGRAVAPTPGATPQAVVPGLLNYLGYAGRYVASRMAQVHRIFHDEFAAAGQESRLVYILAWQMSFSATSWQFSGVIDQYRAALGGGFLPGGETRFACAPYFDRSTPTATFLGGPHAVTALTSAGGVATATAPGHGLAPGATVPVQVANALQPEYCGVVPATAVDADTLTYPVPGTPKSPATVANASISIGIFACPNPPYQRELTAVSVSGGVMTCASRGHGWRTGRVVNLCGTQGTVPSRPHPAIYGRFAITALDPDTFSVTLPPDGDAYVLPTPTTRMWAWDSRALDVLMADVATLPILAPTLQPGSASYAGVAAAAKKYGATHGCYEAGPTFGIALHYPAMYDLCKVANDCPQMYDLLRDYYRRIFAYGAAGANHYNHIGTWGAYGFWGAKEYQHQPATAKSLALMSLAAGPPDYGDGGAPPPAPAPRRWLAGAGR